MDQVTQLGLVVTEAGADPEHLAELTVWLRRELAELPVESVRLVEVDAPAGAKSAGGMALGQLLIAMSGSSVLVALIQTLKDWTRRHDQRTAKLTCGDAVLELGGVSESDQQRLIAEWIERCAGRPRARPRDR
jgi:Effector Associated Constant Component 1